jgi:hypothetical protein
LSHNLWENCRKPVWDATAGGTITRPNYPGLQLRHTADWTIQPSISSCPAGRTGYTPVEAASFHTPVRSWKTAVAPSDFVLR